MKQLVFLLVLSCLVTLVLSATCPVFNGVEYPDIQQTCNNVNHPEWGSVNHQLLRTNVAGNPPYEGGKANYADGVGQILKLEREEVFSIRELTNRLLSQSDTDRICSTKKATDFSVYVGQFLNHDMNFSPGGSGINNPKPIPEWDPIAIPANDPFFENYATLIPFTRSDVVIGTGVNGIQREQFTSLTGYVDLSQVYSPNPAVTDLLREHAGGRMLTQGNFPPTVAYTCDFQAQRLNQDPEAFRQSCIGLIGMAVTHAYSSNVSQILAFGDLRGNENIALTSFQNLFLLNHNYHANQLAAQLPAATDDELFYKARALNIAEYQRIIFRDYVPQLLGSYAPESYKGYQPELNPGINNEFKSAAFRTGHSMVSASILRRHSNGTRTGGDLLLRDCYFQSDRFKMFGGMETILYGTMYQKAQPVDLHVVDSLRHFLFGSGDSSLGMDVTALNIKRARDHGVLTFNQVRIAYGLKPYRSFLELVDGNQRQAQALGSVYESVDKCDLFVCGLAEKPHVKGGLVGETFAVVLRNQFQRLRDGDRFYFENQCQPEPHHNNKHHNNKEEETDVASAMPGTTSASYMFTASECSAIKSITIEDLMERALGERPKHNPFYYTASAPDFCVQEADICY